MDHHEIGAGDHDQEPNRRDYPGHLTLIPRSFFPEVNEDDSNTVKCVKQHRANQANFEQVNDGSFVGRDNFVIGCRGDSNQRGVQDVDEKEKKDRYAGDAVQNPRPHAVATPVQGANGR